MILKNKKPDQRANADQAVSSTNPAKEKPMTSAANTMARSANQSSEAAVAAAMRALEDDVCSLCNMAQILGDLLDHSLVGLADDGKRQQMPEKGSVMKVYLGHQDMEMLSFAWNDVIGRSLRLRDKYSKAWDGVAS